MTVIEFAKKCLGDEEFRCGGVVKNERRYLDAVGFDYTVKGGVIMESGEDLRRLYEALQTILDLDKKYRGE